MQLTKQSRSTSPSPRSLLRPVPRIGLPKTRGRTDQPDQHEAEERVAEKQVTAKEGNAKDPDLLPTPDSVPDSRLRLLACDP